MGNPNRFGPPHSLCYEPTMEPSDGAPRLWIKIYFGNRGQIGPGKIRLLQGIAEHR